MAKRTARSKAAGGGSSRPSEETGFTTRLRSQLRAGSPTPESPTRSSSSRSKKRSSRTDDGSWSTSESGPPKTRITVTLPSGDVVDLNASEVVIDIERPFIDVTTRFSPNKTYMAGRPEFTIKGRL